jgi:hypothetical protein
MARPRRSIPASEKGVRKTIAAPLLESGGKKNPAKLPGSGTDELTKVPPEAKTEKMEASEMRAFIPILKINTEEQTITGVVLQPEIVDAQGDIMSADVIRDAAHRFLADHNRTTKLGLMHKDFKKRFELFESYLAPVDLVIGTHHVKAGAWVIVIHVLAKAIWDKVKAGKLTGFSIGGKAKVTKTNLQAA